ncbi:endoribonuclease dicer-like protein, partial [Trifolium pratense]
RYLATSESLAGAILVDSGYNKEVVWQSIRPLLEPLVTPDIH